MNRRTFLFIALLGVFSAGPALTQTPVAHVYVQTSNGVDLYDAASDGALTLVKGSPFNIGGTWIEAARPSFLFTFDANKVHSFAVASSGAVGAQVDDIDTRNYTGADCGGSADMSGTLRGVLDHTGNTLYVEVLGYAIDAEGSEQAVCEAYQSYAVSSTGKLTFIGAYVTSTGCCYNNQLTVSGTNKYAYTVNADWSIVDFMRESNGALDHFNATVQAPPAGSAGGKWAPQIVDVGVSFYGAVLGSFVNSSGAAVTPRKLVSYTVNSNGDLTTTNTYAELPTPSLTPEMLTMSPSGKFLAAGGDSSTGGLQIFHFNGASPITADSGLLGNAQVLQLHWDNNNHVYAFDVENNLWIYTVTTTAITPAPGSPYKTAGGGGGADMLVIPVS